MKKTLLVSLCLVLSVALVASLAFAKNSNGRYSTYKPQMQLESTVSLDQGFEPLQAAAAQGTTWLATYTFDSGANCVAEGWTSADITAQLGDFWHVEDFIGMGANYQGNVGVLSGLQSLWCGSRAVGGTGPLCGYIDLPGYGNNWNQGFCTLNCVAAGPGAVLQFEADWDSEPGYDASTLEVTACTDGTSDDNWVTLDGGTNVWDGNLDDFSLFGDTTITIAIPDSLHIFDGPNPPDPTGSSNSLRVRFHFVSDGAWSDEDGLWDTDGWGAIDNVSLTTLPTETFELESQGDVNTLSGNWGACTPQGYGDFSGLYSAITLVTEDPCNSNITCVWAFFNGSTANYGCGGFPGQLAVPYENLRGQYINNEVWSPSIPLIGSGVQFQLLFDVYRDLALDPLVFYVWHVRSIDVSGCAGGWFDRNFVYFGPNKDWLRPLQPFGDLVEPGAVAIQVALGVVDMCPFWCGQFGTGACHSHAPLIDNVEVRRIEAQGPQWSVRDIDLFQDNFSEDGTTTGTARIDGAIDILPAANPNFRPGDSLSVTVSDPEAGLADDAYTGFGGAVYAYVSTWNGTAPDYSGDQYTSDSFRWPVVDSLIHDGQKWYCIRMDTSFTDGDARTGAQPDKFCLDLNDSLWVPCDTICFIFTATSGPASGATTYWTPVTGVTDDLAFALNNPGECTILPAAGWKRGGDILYVDGMNFRGAQPFFDSAFDLIGILDEIDRYDIRGPSSNVANRPGARVIDPLQQLLPCYQKIIWNTGNLNDGLIGDGTTTIEKSNDALMLETFLDNLEVPGGIYFNGDNIADEWQLYTGNGITLRDKYIQHQLVNPDHVAQGFAVSPLVIGDVGGCFDHVTGPDTMIAYGGCALINDFDVIEPAGPSTQEMHYDGGAPAADGAVVGQKTQNTTPDSTEVGVLLSGFSFHYIRDDKPNSNGVPDRAEHMYDILVWLGNLPPVPTPATPTYNTSLSQNYPNPFNPTTTIDFTVKELAPVTVKIYNVRGQLVKTLVNDTYSPGVTHQVKWNGRNDAGQSVASGVYFYKLVTKDFTQTKKMVLLK